MSSFASAPNSSREAQVASWEKHLANIIEQTNHNINYLSKSVNKTSSSSTSTSSNKYHHHSNDVQKPPPLPPPPPLPSQPLYDNTTGHRIRNSIRSTSSHHEDHPQRKSFQSHVQPTISTNYYEQQAREAIEASRATGYGGGGPLGVGVTRPLPKHVEDTLRRSILQSVKRSVEQSVSEKTHASQTRVDKLSDKCVALSEDLSKVRKEYGILFRSMATQDRATKRLKQEWENQGVIMKKLESAMIQDMGWKESTAMDVQMLKDHQRDDAAARVTVAEMKNSMERISSKSMDAIERAMVSAKKAFGADVQMLKDEMNTLKEENKRLKEELRLNNEINRDFEGRAKSVISNAVQCHFDRVEGKITQSVRASINNDLREIQEKTNFSNFRDGVPPTEEQIKNCFAREAFKDQSEIHIAMSSIIAKKLDENKKSLSDRLLKSTLTTLMERITKPGDTFNAYITGQVEKAKSEVESELKNVTEKYTELKSNYSEIKELVEKKMKCIPTKPDALTQVIGLLEPRLSSLEKFVEESKVSYADKDRVEKLESNCKNMLEKLRNIAENGSEATSRQDALFTKSIDQIKKDVSLLHNVIEIKCRSSENDARVYTDAKLQEKMRDMEEIQSKVKITQSCCETLTSSLNILKELSDRIDKLEGEDAVPSYTSAIQKADVGRDQNSTDLGGEASIFASLMEKNNIDFDTLCKKIASIDQWDCRLKGEVASQTSALSTSKDVQTFKQEVLQVVGDLEERLKSIDRASVDVTETSSVLSEAFAAMKSDFEQLSLSCARQQYNAEDLASCFGRISSVERKLRNEMFSVKGELVDNVMSINATSTERIDILVMEMRKEMTSIKAMLPAPGKDEVQITSTDISTANVDVSGLKHELLLVADQGKQHRSMIEALDKMFQSKTNKHDNGISEIRAQMQEIKRKIDGVTNDVKGLSETVNQHASKLIQNCAHAKLDDPFQDAVDVQPKISEESSSLNEVNANVTVGTTSVDSLSNQEEMAKPTKEEEESDTLRAIGTGDDPKKFVQEAPKNVQENLYRDENILSTADNNDHAPSSDQEEIFHNKTGLFVVSENVEGVITDFDSVERVENVTTTTTTSAADEFMIAEREQSKGARELFAIAEGSSIAESISSFEEESIASIEDDVSSDGVASDLISYSDESRKGDDYDSDFEEEI